ncbi:MAG: DotD/TraH family lipoprotein [Alphaproteobacteria bacterium]
MAIRKNIIIVFGAALLLAGCSEWNKTFDPPPTVKPIATEPDIVSVKLAQAADKASQSLDTIANIEQQKNPAVPPMPATYANASPNIMQPVTLRWSGPIEQVSRTLAERAGLRFRVKGREPEVPLLVNLDVYQQPILQVLRDIGMQAGSRADLSVDTNEGVVEVRYAPTDQSH